MLVNSPITLVASVFGPTMVQRTRVRSGPSGIRTKSMVLADLNGFSKARAIRTSVGAAAWVTRMLPLPALRLPDQAYSAPTPDSAPV
jgi:hypothetical protein